MPALFRTDFFLRFAGGFALGAVTVAGSQLVGWFDTVVRFA